MTHNNPIIAGRMTPPDMSDDSISFYKTLKAGQGLLPAIKSLAAATASHATTDFKKITITDGDNHIKLDDDYNIIVPDNTQADIFITPLDISSISPLRLMLSLGKKSVANVFWQDDAGDVAPLIGVIDFTCCLAADSQLNHFSFFNLHNTLRCQQTIRLQGDGASVNIFVGGKADEATPHVKLALPAKTTSQPPQPFADSTIHIIHESGNSLSRVAIRGVVDDSEVMIGQVRTDIAQDATGADTTQDIKAMILSPEAKFFGKPELNIKHDKVKAKHGLSVGAMDENQIYYLRARGIDDATARRLLLSSFFINGLNLFSGDLLKKAVKWLQPLINQPV
ncbi:MAG: SufD family Fe-S cluster assembly protein [Hydrotalea sp.]|nr:SufD family Fe-S cluster assembly protein [Hydrotalea sp.]